MLCLEAHNPFLVINFLVVIKKNIASQDVGTRLAQMNLLRQLSLQEKETSASGSNNDGVECGTRAIDSLSSRNHSRAKPFFVEANSEPPTSQPSKKHTSKGGQAVQERVPICQEENTPSPWFQSLNQWGSVSVFEVWETVAVINQ